MLYRFEFDFFLREINFALFFADVSCNTCPWLLNTLQHLDFNFSCQSRPEIQHILAQNIDPTRVLFANPTKVASHIKAAVSNGVDLMVFGSLHEIKVIFVHFWQFWSFLAIYVCPLLPFMVIFGLFAICGHF